METKKFALIGAAGYIAPRHMEAIKETGNELVAAFDPFDSVGIIDRYFPNTAFFTEFERFDRHLEKLKRIGKGVDYVTVCSPNYLHDAHCRFGLRLGADVICEKPLVLNSRNVLGLIEAEQDAQQKINCILQARLHEEALNLKAFVTNTQYDRYSVNIDYVTPRGQWYDFSWKGEERKSGGVATNIGVHLFDLVLSNFGSLEKILLSQKDPRICCGVLKLEKADVKFRLSVEHEVFSDGSAGRRRVFSVNDKPFDLSGGFEELHINSYQKIVDGEGFGVRQALPAIRLVEAIRKATVNTELNISSLEL